MGLKRTEGFRKDTVRIALTNELTRKQVAGDLGVGMSAPNKWITAHRESGVVSKEDCRHLEIPQTSNFASNGHGLTARLASAARCCLAPESRSQDMNGSTA